jgi:hypothetical protein
LFANFCNQAASIVWPNRFQLLDRELVHEYFVRHAVIISDIRAAWSGAAANRLLRAVDGPVVWQTGSIVAAGDAAGSTRLQVRQAFSLTRAPVRASDQIEREP